MREIFHGQLEQLSGRDVRSDRRRLSALARADDRLDALHREVLDAVSLAEPPYPIQVAADITLLARYYERFADQAASVAKRLDYVVAGTMPDKPPT